MVLVLPVVLLTSDEKRLVAIGTVFACFCSRARSLAGGRGKHCPRVAHAQVTSHSSHVTGLLNVWDKGGTPSLALGELASPTNRELASPTDGDNRGFPQWAAISLVAGCWLLGAHKRGLALGNFLVYIASK